MDKLTFEKVKEFIGLELDEFRLEQLRQKHRIAGDSSTFYTSITRLVQDKELKRIGRGFYRKVKPALPIKVFGRERRPAIRVNFPQAQDTKEELSFAEGIIFREGDLILLSGQSNKGKTTLCMNFCGENILSNPVLMGNEYSTLDNEPTPRFLSRLDSMDWVEWANGDGEDNFTLLPVRQDYAEHVVKDKLNIIDWINLDANSLYDISAVMADIKGELGKGVGVIAIQKKEGEGAGRGGQFTKDFADCELLLDQFGDHEILLTVGKVKEYNRPVMGRMFVYTIIDGVRIMNFREVLRCPACKGNRYIGGKQCTVCDGMGKIDK